MAGEAENKANSASIKVEVEAELGKKCFRVRKERVARVANLKLVNMIEYSQMYE